jgi:hypothetical protein
MITTIYAITEFRKLRDLGSLLRLLRDRDAGELSDCTGDAVAAPL